MGGGSSLLPLLYGKIPQNSDGRSAAMQSHSFLGGIAVLTSSQTVYQRTPCYSTRLIYALPGSS